MPDYLLVFDAGTGAGRCALFDSRGAQIATAYQEWDYSTPADTHPNGRIFSPDDFWAILCGLSQQVIKQSGIDTKKIIGVSSTSQREGMVFLDSKGKEIYAGPNIDNRGIEEYTQFLDQEESIRSITGLRLFSLLGPARLLWFMKCQPEIYQNIKSILMISDWIVYRLCGELFSEYSIASSSQMLDISTLEWSSEVAQILNFKREFLPPLHHAGTVIGKITKQSASESGLAEGTNVIAGGGDTHIGMLGIGIVRQECISAIAGTSTPVMATVKTPYIDPYKRVSTSCYITPGLWALESNAGMTGMSYRWVRDIFAQDIVENCKLTGNDSYEELNKIAEEIPPGSSGWNAYLGAYRSGGKHGNMGGFFFPLTWILSNNYDRRHLIRSAIETMAYGVRVNFEQLMKITNKNQSEFRVGGGQTNSKLFNSILATILNLPVVIYTVKESTSLGAAICAAKGSGIYGSITEAAQQMVHIDHIVDPDPNQIVPYDEAYQKWVEFGDYLSKFNSEEK